MMLIYVFSIGDLYHFKNWIIYGEKKEGYLKLMDPFRALSQRQYNWLKNTRKVKAFICFCSIECITEKHSAGDFLVTVTAAIGGTLKTSEIKEIHYSYKVNALERIA